MAALYFLRDWRRFAVMEEEVQAGERWFQNANASLAVSAGWYTALVWQRAQLGEFYLVVAALCAAGAWTRARQVRGGDGVVAVLTAKAVGALTLGVIELAEARTVALALLVQAWVLAWTARRLGSRVLAAGSAVAPTVATWFYFMHGAGAAPVFSPMALQAVLFTLGLAALATEAGRWLVGGAEARRLLEMVAAAVAALGALVAVSHWTPAGWEPTLAMALGLAFLAVAWARRGRAAAWAAAGVAFVAQTWLWEATNAQVIEGGGSTLGWNAWAVLVPTVWAGAWMGGREGTGWRRGGALAWALAVVGAVLVAFESWSGALALVAVLAVAAVLGLLSAWLPTRRLPWLATLGAVLAGFCALEFRAASAGAAWAGWAALAAWALPLGLRVFARCDAVRRAEPLAETMERLQVLVATALSLRALLVWLHGPQLVGGLAALASVLFVVALRPGVRPALAASWAVWLLVLLALRITPLRIGSAPMAGVALLAWLPAWLWVWAPERWRAHLSGWRSRADAVQCGLATAVGLVVAFEVFRGASAVWALAGLTVCAALTARPGGARLACTASVVTAIFLSANALEFIARGEAEGWGTGLGLILLAAALLAALPLWLDAARHRGWRLAGGGAGLTLVFAAFGAQNGFLAHFATVGWGLAAIGLFMGGLFWRIAPYRVLGLVGLALCVPRIFVVDLHSALHRIAAFLVIGGVLLWVGFSYHRFRHFLSDSSDHPTTPK